MFLWSLRCGICLLLWDIVAFCDFCLLSGSWEGMTLHRSEGDVISPVDKGLYVCIWSVYVCLTEQHLIAFQLCWSACNVSLNTSYYHIQGNIYPLLLVHLLYILKGKYEKGQFCISLF